MQRDVQSIGKGREKASGFQNCAVLINGCLLTGVPKLYNTNIHEKIAEQKKAGKIADDAECVDKAVESSGSYVSESEEVLPVKPVSARDLVEEHPDRTIRKPHAM